MYRATQTADPYLRPSFSLPNRMRRQAWSVCCALLFRTSPRPFHSWRAFLLRCFGAQLGPIVIFIRRSRIWAPWNLVCADGVSLGDEAEIYNPSPVSMGSHAIVSQQAYICGATHDYNDPSFPLISFPMSLGAYSWVCARASVAPGSERRRGGGAWSGFGGHARSGALDCLRRRSGPDGSSRERAASKWNAHDMSSCGSQLPLTATVKRFGHAIGGKKSLRVTLVGT